MFKKVMNSLAFLSLLALVAPSVSWSQDEEATDPATEELNLGDDTATDEAPPAKVEEAKPADKKAPAKKVAKKAKKAAKKKTTTP